MPTVAFGALCALTSLVVRLAPGTGWLGFTVLLATYPASVLAAFFFEDRSDRRRALGWSLAFGFALAALFVGASLRAKGG